MQVIPVIDLKGGIVVHAKRGEREHYQPVQSILTCQCTLEAVLHGFLAHYPFQTFYIADLDAIKGTGYHRDLIQTLANEYPAIEFWLDEGSQFNHLTPLAANITPVIGTESQLLPPEPRQQDFILSLDFAGDTALGHAAWFEQSAYWPQRIVVMNLAKVGADGGCDWQKLLHFKQRYPEKTWIAAGGVRHARDLQQLADQGITHALVASALHSGAIDLSLSPF